MYGNHKHIPWFYLIKTQKTINLLLKFPYNKVNNSLTNKSRNSLAQQINYSIL